MAIVVVQYDAGTNGPLPLEGAPSRIVYPPLSPKSPSRRRCYYIHIPRSHRAATRKDPEAAMTLSMSIVMGDTPAAPASRLRAPPTALHPPLPFPPVTGHPRVFPRFPRAPVGLPSSSSVDSTKIRTAFFCRPKQKTGPIKTPNARRATRPRRSHR